MPTQKTQRGERERQRAHLGRKETPPHPWPFGSSYYMFFFLPLGLPYVNWASQECCLFYLRSSLQSSDLPLIQDKRAFPFLVFQPLPFWTPFSYSNYLTGLWNLRIKLTSIYILNYTVILLWTSFHAFHPLNLKNYHHISSTLLIGLNLTLDQYMLVDKSINSSHFLLLGIFPDQGLNPRLLNFLHWQTDSLPLCHLRSPYLLLKYSNYPNF